MKARIMGATLAAAVGVACMGMTARADSVTAWTVTGTNGGQPAEAAALFSISNSGYLTLTLTNTAANPVSASSLFGGVVFTFSNSAVTATNFSVVSGTLIGLNSSGEITAPDLTGLDSTDNWGVSGTGTLTTKVGGNNPLIIGSPDSSNVYSAANPSLVGGNGKNSTPPHQPLFETSATFGMQLAGYTSGTTISSVNFLFGTDFQALTSVPGSGSTPPVPAVPLPAGGSAGIVAAAGLASVGALRRLRTRRAV